MNDTVLDFRFGEDCLNGSRKPSQIVRAGNEDIFHTAIAQTIQHSCPELGAFVFTDPHSQDIFPSIEIDTNGDIDCFFDNLPFASDMVVDGIQKYHLIDGLQWPLLPFFCDGKNFWLTVVSETSMP